MIRNEALSNISYLLNETFLDQYIYKEKIIFFPMFILNFKYVVYYIHQFVEKLRSKFLMLWNRSFLICKNIKIFHAFFYFSCDEKNSSSKWCKYMASIFPAWRSTPITINSVNIWFPCIHKKSVNIWFPYFHK